MRMYRLWLSATLALGATFVAMAAPPPVANASGPMAGASGQTLYTYDADTVGRSACYGPCAALWPPYLADAGATAHGALTLVRRKDGSRQWAWRGKPLYRYTGDRSSRDAKGDGMNGTWHVIR